MFSAWAHHADSIRRRTKELLDGLPPLPDNKEVLADKRARILELQNAFWAMHRSIVDSGAAALMHPYFRAESSGEYVPNEIYQEIQKYRSANKSMMMNLMRRGDKWIDDAEKTFGALAEPAGRLEPTEEEAEWAREAS